MPGVRSQFNDTVLKSILTKTKTLTRILERTLYDNIPLGQAITDEHLGMSQTRRVLRLIHQIEPQDQIILPTINPIEIKNILASPMERLYADICGYDTATWIQKGMYLPKDADEALNYCMKHYLTDYEADVIQKCYLKEMTMAEYAKHRGVTANAVRLMRNKALRKLRYPKRIQILTYGLRLYEQSEKLQEERNETLMRSLFPESANTNPPNIPKFFLEQSIDVLNLNIRTQNRLRMSGKLTIQDILIMSNKDFLSIKNGFGAESIQDAKTKTIRYLQEKTGCTYRDIVWLKEQLTGCKIQTDLWENPEL